MQTPTMLCYTVTLVCWLYMHSCAVAHDVSTLVREYSNYRREAGCDVNLCSVTETDNNVTLTVKSSVTETDNNVTLILKPRVPFETSCCTGCSCESNCERYGSCCPDLLQSFPYSDQYPIGGIFDCACSRYSHSAECHRDDSIMVVSKCNKTYLDINIAQQCNPSTKHPWNTSRSKDLESYVPVIDVRTNETYRNYFCAMCNFVEEEYVVYWKADIACPDKMVFIPRGLPTIIEDINAVPKCSITFSPPTATPYPSVCDTFISSCNETGQWTDVDDIVLAACASYRAPFAGRYTNIFCYLCNENATRFENSVCVSEPTTAALNAPDDLISYSILLDFRRRPEVLESTKSTCSGGLVYDYYQDECHEVVCPEMTIYDNGTCRSLFPEIPAGVCYELFIKLLVVDGNISPGRQEFQTSVEIYFRSLLYKIDGTMSCFHLHAKYTNSSTITDPSDSVVHHVLHVQVSGKRSRHLAEDLIKLDNTSINIPVSAWNVTVTVAVNVEPYEVVPLPFGHNGYTGPAIWQQWTSDFLPRIDGDYPWFICEVDTFVLTKMSVCPRITLNITKFAFKRNQRGLYLIGLELHLHLGSFEYNTQTKQVSVCVSDYIPQTEVKYGVNRLIRTNDIVSSLLTLSCSITSIVCLIIVLASYGTFSSLRTQPGVNNMALSISLILSQTLLIVSANRTDLGVGCSIIGGMIHFLFLTVIFWMGICCVHMFRVFRKLPSSKPVGSIRTTTAIYTAIVCVMSVTSVAVNIVVTYIRSSGLDYGYGGIDSMCYISSAAMIGYTITLPAGLVVVCNCTLFMCVVYSISTMPVVQSSTMENRRYFTVYVRLSTITGIAWLSVVPYIVTDNRVFEYISIILTSSQGVYICVAFIVNKRVFKLYKDLVRKIRNMTHSSSTLRTTGV